MRPYVVCHMVASIDGRIDCAMVDKISGDEYYTTLRAKEYNIDLSSKKRGTFALGKVVKGRAAQAKRTKTAKPSHRLSVSLHFVKL